MARAVAENFSVSWTANNPPYVIFKWTIENLSLAKTVLKSPCFDVSRTSKWNLILDPHVVVGEEVSVGIYLRRNARCSDMASRIFLIGEMTVHGPENELLFDKTFEHVDDQATNTFLDFRMPKVLFAQVPYGCCGNDKYLIRCEMILLRDDRTTNDWKPHLEKLSYDLKGLYADGMLMDFTVRTADDVISVQKAMLNVRSKVLKNILEESVTYIDAGHEKSLCVAAVLLFVNTGNPDYLLDTFPVELFGKIAVLAKKWSLDELENIMTPWKMHCATRIRFENFQYMWRIKNFTRLYAEAVDGLQSAEFVTNDDTNSRWRLILERSPENNLGLYLVKVRADNLSHSTDVEFRIYNRNSVTKRREYVFGPRNDHQRCGFSSICSVNYANSEIVKDDTLFVECRVKFCLDSESWNHFTSTFVDVSDDDPYSFKYLKTLSRNLKDLYVSEKYADLKLCTQNRVHGVHRFIVWARSPYFRNLLTTRSVEYINVAVEDDTLEEVLMYIYSAELPQLTLLNCIRLYKASHLFKLEMLLRLVRFYLFRNITVDNVLEFMIMAHKHDDTELVEATVRFASMPGNAKQILNTTRWLNFRRTYIEFGFRIYHNLAWAYCNAF